MIKVNALAFLFILQFLVIFLGFTILLFFRYRKLNVREIISRGEANRLREELEHMEGQHVELSSWKEMFNNLQEKFDHIRGVNTTLKESIATLIPEADRSKKYEQLISEIEQNNKELDTCIGELQKENKQLNKNSKTFERDLDQLSRKLDLSVSKEAYNNLKAQKKSLELKFEKLKKDLAAKTREHESLQKNYVWLEKEYNALYENISEDDASN